MRLVLERLSVMGHLQCFHKRLDVIGILISRGKNSDGNRDAGGILGIDHGRMHFSGNLEWRTLAAREGDDLCIHLSAYALESCRNVCTHLAAPTFAQDRPRFDAIGLADRLNQARNLLDGGSRVGRTSKERAHGLALLGRIWGKPRNVGVLAEEEIRREDLVLLLRVAVGEQVGALHRLRAVAEDVVDDENGFLGRSRARLVCIGSISGLRLLARGSTYKS